MSNIQFHITPAYWALLIILGVLWGSSFYVQAILLTDLPTFSLVFFRILSASISLHVVLFFTNHKKEKNKIALNNIVQLALVLNVLPFLLLVWAQNYISSGVAAIINSFTPMATLILSIKMVPEDKITLPRLLALIIGIAGVSLLIGIDGLNYGWNILIPFLSALAATFCYGYGANLLYCLRHKTSLLLLCTRQLTIASVILFPFWLVIDQPWNFIDSFDSLHLTNYVQVFLHVLWIGVLSTSIAYLLFYKIISKIGPANGSLVTFIVPGVSILFGYYLLDEVFYFNHIFGFILILISLVFINRARPKI